MSGARASTGRRVIATLSGASLVQAGAAAAAGLWATLVLGAEARGVMVIAVTTAAIAGLTAGLGTGSAYRAQLPQADPATRSALAVAYAAVSLAGALAAAGLSVLILLLAAPAITDDLAAPRLVTVVALAAFFQCLTAQALEAWWADGRFSRGAGLAVAAAACGFGGLVVAGAISATPTSMLVGQVLGEGTIAVVSLVLLGRTRLFVVGRPPMAEVRGLVRQGWPTLGVSVGTILTFRADRYLIGVFVGPAAITVYSLAATLGEITRTVPHALGQVLIRRIAERDPTVVLARTVRQAMVAVALSGALVAVVGWVAIPVVFDQELHDARQYLLLLLGAEVLFAPFFIGSRGLVGGGWTRATGAIGAAGSILAVVSYLLLVPPFGLAGACAASAAVYFLLSVVSVTALRNRLRARAALDQTDADVAPDAVPTIVPVTP